MRVLITGARGMLGRCSVRAFSDCDVLAWDRDALDITDAAQVRARVGAARPDVVVNAAAYNAVDRAEGDSTVADAVNGGAVGHLAGAAAACGAIFLHYSTDYVFDGMREHGYAEDDTPNPINAYGRSKLAGERALLEVAARYAGGSAPWRWYCVRTSRLFGAPGTSASAKRSFVDTMVASSATEDRLEVVDGEVSSPTYAPDLAAATRALVASGAPSGVYHRTNDGSCTWFAFARAVLRIAGWSGTVIPVSASAYPRPAARPSCSVLRTTKLPPMRRWEDALAEYLDALPLRFTGAGAATVRSSCRGDRR